MMSELELPRPSIRLRLYRTGGIPDVKGHLMHTCECRDAHVGLDVPAV